MAVPEVRDKSPWFGTAEEGLRWILRPDVCKTEQVELVAEKALAEIERLKADRPATITEYIDREHGGVL